MRTATILILLASTACTDQNGPEKVLHDSGDLDEEDETQDEQGEDVEQDPAPTGVPALGAGSHSLDAVAVVLVAERSDGLRTPRDLAFNPDVEGELWVVNRANDSATIFQNAGESTQTSESRVDPYALHFMEEVSSIAMGGVTFAESDARTFGTCHESRNTYNGRGRPNDFMGPTLWSADLDIFAVSNPEAVEYLSDLFGTDVDLGSHLDMLHESPNCMGIAWDHDNVYWVYDGFNATLARYDFAADHHIGYDDHSDGIIGKVSDLELTRLEDVPSHMEIDQTTGLLYAVDTGANRILVVDTTTGERGARLPVTERGVTHHELDNVDYEIFLDGADIEGMEAPSGLALVDETLLISDFETGRIFAFDLDGELVDWVDSGHGGGIMGLAARGLNDIWFVDGTNDALVRLQPQ